MRWDARSLPAPAGASPVPRSLRRRRFIEENVLFSVNFRARECPEMRNHAENLRIPAQSDHQSERSAAAYSVRWMHDVLLSLRCSWLTTDPFTGFGFASSILRRIAIIRDGFIRRPLPVSHEPVGGVLSVHRRNAVLARFATGNPPVPVRIPQAQRVICAWRRPRSVSAQPPALPFGHDHFRRSSRTPTGLLPERGLPRRDA